MGKKFNVDPSKLETKVVRLPGYKEYYVKVGMIGRFESLAGVYACEVWIGADKTKMKPRAFTIGGQPHIDADKIKAGEDIHDRVNLVLDLRKRVKGVIWK